MKVKNRAKPKLTEALANRFYMAYGSNLNKEAMKLRCPDSVVIGKRMIKNAKLVFRGVADIAYEPGSRTPVGLWKISARDERNLDRFEGVASGMYRKKMIDIGHGNEALIYLMNDDGVYPPSKYYTEVILQGYKDFGLDTSYLHQALVESFDKEPSEQTEWRRARQKASEHESDLVELPESVAFEKQEKINKRLAASDDLA